METRRTSFFWARTSAEEALCSGGVRRESWEMRELMFRRIGWERDAAEESFGSSSVVAGRLERYDLINEIRDSRVRIALRRVLRLAITVARD